MSTTPTVDLLSQWIAGAIAEQLALAPSVVAKDAAFSTLGLDSLEATRLIAKIGEKLGRSLPATLVWEHPTIEALARALIEAPAALPRGDDRAPPGEPIAIVGLACRFPGAEDVDAYWRLLAEGRSAIGPLPAGRWDPHWLAALDDAERSKLTRGGFLPDIAGFDPHFFGISPKEANVMDPQQRLILELCYEALCDAAIAPRTLRHSATAVFAGAIWSDYTVLAHRGGPGALGPHAVTGSHHAIIANRLSYAFGLFGPSFTLDAACASGLVAVHLACDSLRRGECTAAIAAAVNLAVLPDSALSVARLGALSPDHQCYAFDARANGYVRGEGGGVLILKTLTRAIADGDPIHAIVRGSAVNNDGASNGLTAPNPRAQAALLDAAYRSAGVAPSAVQYIEAHGTGTPLGDPIEARALGAFFAPGRGEPLAIGSAKTNLGHLEGAAGIAGLIKVILALRHRRLPASLGYAHDNPHAPLAELRLRVPTALEAWPRPDAALVAGVSAFGLGGTNAHVVVEEWPPHAPAAAKEGVDTSHGVVFVFAGQGAQWPGMGRELLRADPVARRVLEQCSAHVERLLGWSLVDEIARGSPRLSQIDVSLPAIIAIDVAIAASLRARGVEPAAVIGHSTGEIAAAHVAGALSLEETMRVICAYGTTIATMRGQGAMVLVELPWDEAAAIAKENGVYAAIQDSHDATVLGGAPTAIARVVEALRARGVLCRAVDIDVSPHCALVDALRPALLSTIGTLAPQPSRAVAFVSEVSGGVLDGARLDAAHWARNFAEPARFSDGVDALIAKGHRAFVNVAPHPINAHAIAVNAKHAQANAAVVATLRRGEQGELGAIATQLGATATSSLRVVLPLSAASPKALETLIDRTIAGLDAVRLADAAYTASVRRDHFAHRVAAVGSTGAEMIAALHRARERIAKRPRFAAKIAFVLPGQGAARPLLPRAWLAAHPAFTDALAACDTAIARHGAFSVLEELAAPAERSRFGEIAVTQPLIFALAIAHAALWRAHGVAPAAVVGHSMGEVAAAHLAGVLTLDEAARVICARSALLGRLSGTGGMALVELGAKDARAAIAKRPLAVAAENGPRATVVAGDATAIAELVVELDQKGVFCRRLGVDVASHTAQMDPLAQPLADATAAIAGATPQLTWMSSVDAAPIDRLRRTYWFDNLRRPVLFQRAIERLLDDGVTTFIELGPQATLLHAIGETLQARGPTLDARAICAGAREGDPEHAWLDALAAAYESGASIAWEASFPSGGVPVRLPAYPWQRERHWLAPVIERVRAATGGDQPLLDRGLSPRGQRGTRHWELPLSAIATTCLGAHALEGEAVLPASAYIALAAEAGARMLGDRPIEIADLRLHEMLFLDDDARRRLQVTIAKEQLEIASVQDDADGVVHASAVICVAEPGVETQPVTPSGEPIADAARFYSSLHARGVDYGPGLRTVERVWRDGDTVRARVSLPGVGDDGYRAHPGFVDACFQILPALFPDQALVPAAIARVRVFAKAAGPAWIVARKRGDTAADASVIDDRGEVLVALDGIALAERSADALGRCGHAIVWREKPLIRSGGALTPGAWLLVCDRGGILARVAERLRERGHVCLEIASAAEVATGITEVRRAHKKLPWHGVIYGACLDDMPRPLAELDLGAIETAIRQSCIAALTTAQAIINEGLRGAPKVWLLTRGAQAVIEGEAPAIGTAPVWSLARTLAMEVPELWCARVDVDPRKDAGIDAAIVDELTLADGEDQIALRGDVRHVARLVRRRIAPATEPRLDAGATYLVTGGLGGLGLQAARWLAKLGAKRIMLVGRRPPSPNAAQAIAALEADGVRVLVRAADVASKLDVTRLVGACERLRGVIHAAGTLDDCIVALLGEERFWKPLAAKVHGAWNLHLATLSQPLDFFVTYSSAATLLGTIGQANYAAANAFLDALAQARRAAGLCATSIAWGTFDVGFAAPTLRHGERLAARGFSPLSEGDGHALLSRAIASHAPNLALLRFDPAQWLAAYPHAGAPYFSELDERTTPIVDASALRARLSQEAPHTRRASVLAVVLAGVERALSVPADRLDAETPLRFYGLDSATSLELRRKLEQALGLHLSAATFFTHPTAAAITDKLCAELDAG
ncbi:MAG: SDR family NAD(P)-dependent oxidoreductase [Deltaproteobacteria bacterium]|nr:SDR family NAD(P)-dependent oxidoreductase [Deltaproteobacteria bacterium]